MRFFRPLMPERYAADLVKGFHGHTVTNVGLEGGLLVLELLQAGGGVVVAHRISLGVDGVFARGVDERRGEGAVFFGVDGGEQDGGIGGEALQDAQLAAQAHDGDACAGRHGLEVPHGLVLDEDLILGAGVQGVEQQHVDRAGGRLGLQVGVDVRRQLRELAGDQGGVFADLREAANGLRLAIFEHGEGGLRQAVDGLTLGVGDGDVDDGEAREGAQGKLASLLRLRWGRGSGRLREEQCGRAAQPAEGRRAGEPAKQFWLSHHSLRIVRTLVRSSLRVVEVFPHLSNETQIHY